MTKKSRKREVLIKFDNDLTKLMESAGVQTHEEKIAVCKVLTKLDIAWGELETYKKDGVSVSCYDYSTTEKFDKLMSGDLGTEDDDDSLVCEIEYDAEFESALDRGGVCLDDKFVVAEVLGQLGLAHSAFSLVRDENGQNKVLTKVTGTDLLQPFFEMLERSDERARREERSEGREANRPSLVVIDGGIPTR